MNLHHLPVPTGVRRIPYTSWYGNEILFLLDPIAYLQHGYALAGPVAAGLHDWPFWVMIAGAEANRVVLTDPELFHAFFLSLPAAPDSNLHHLANGLLHMNGATHRTYRQLLLPAFHRRSIAQSFSDMIALTLQTLDRWQPGEVVDIVAAMRALTLTMVERIVFGLQPEDQVPELLPQIRAWMELFTHPVGGLLPFNVPGLPYHRLLRASDALAATIRRLLAARRAVPTEQHAAFDLLAHARTADGNLLDETTVLGQASLLFTAGHETSANALVWTLILLALHPAICADLGDELDGVLRGAPPTQDDLERLPLLNRVVRESLRLLPPVVYGARRAQEECAVLGRRLARQTIVLFSPFMTHRVSSVFEHPAQFRPARWETISPDPYEYIPFGAGPRRCLGETFALQEISIVLAMLLQRFQPELVSPTRIDYQVRITLNPAGAVPLRLCPRSGRVNPSEITGSLRRLIDLPA